MARKLLQGEFEDGNVVHVSVIETGFAIGKSQVH